MVNGCTLCITFLTRIHHRFSLRMCLHEFGISFWYFFSVAKVGIPTFTFTCFENDIKKRHLHWKYFHFGRTLLGSTSVPIKKLITADAVKHSKQWQDKPSCRLFLFPQWFYRIHSAPHIFLTNFRWFWLTFRWEYEYRSVFYSSLLPQSWFVDVIHPVLCIGPRCL